MFKGIQEDLCMYQRQLKPSHAVAGGQGSLLRTAFHRGFRYCFSKTEQRGHLPSWKLLAGKQSITLGGKACPVTEIRQSWQGQLHRAKRCLDTTPSVRLPACWMYSKAPHATKKETQYTEIRCVQQEPRSVNRN